MTSIPCNEGIMLTTSQLVFAFILLRHLHIYKNVYIYSKEIRRLVIASNNAPVVK
jgi:hypothetical protein